MPRQPIKKCQNCNKPITQLEHVRGRTRRYCDSYCRLQMFYKQHSEELEVLRDARKEEVEARKEARKAQRAQSKIEKLQNEIEELQQAS